MIVIDTETTGLLAPSAAELYAQPHCIQIYALQVCPKTFKVQDEFETYIKPPIPIPEFITKITRIDDGTVANAPSFIEIFDDLAELFLGETEVLGQNVNFDMEVLQHEFERIGMQYHFPYPAKRYDTVEMSYPIQNKRLKLGQLYEHCFGEGFANAHDAKADAMATLKCFRWLKENGY